MKKFKTCKLVRTTKSFEEAWESLKTFVVPIQEMFGDVTSERDVKMACIDVISEHLPMCELNERIENGFFNLVIQSNRVFLRTPRNVTFGYVIDYIRSEENVVTDKTYNFTLEINSKDYNTKKLLINNGWEEVITEEE